MIDSHYEMEPQQPANGFELRAPGETLPPEELLKVVTGELEGHYWTFVDTGEVCEEGTLAVGDQTTLDQLCRQYLTERPDCQYAGQITTEQARVRYRAELWKVWLNLYK